VILLRMRVTSAAISGATFCLTVMAIFLVLDHFSGNSCSRKMKLYASHSFIRLFQNPTDPSTGHINHWI
jgi:hypothetical protein